MTEALPTYQDIGLPAGHGDPKLIYHAPTNSIVVHTRPNNSRLPSRRLSIRRVSEPHYQSVCDFPPSISVDSFAISPTLPALYFLTYEWSEHSNGPVGGKWDALYQFNLDTHQSKVVAHRDELIPPNGYESAWLCALYSVSADGCKIFCKAALRGVEPIDYCISELSIADRKLTPITKLEAIFA